MQKSNNVLQTTRSDKFIPKSSIVRSISFSNKNPLNKISFSYVVEKIILPVYRIIVQEKPHPHQQHGINNRSFRIHFIVFFSCRPSSTRNLNSPGGADWNQSEEGIDFFLFE
jgi:hypothetical protein